MNSKLRFNMYVYTYINKKNHKIKLLLRTTVFSFNTRLQQSIFSIKSKLVNTEIKHYKIRF